MYKRQLLVFSLSVGLLLAALNVQYRDVKYALPFLVQLWMFASPVIYPSSMAPESLRLLLAINPMTGLLEAFRVVVFPSAPLHWGYLGLSLASTAVLAVVATLYFRRTERVIADVI